ncbi:MAG: hypothetical protein AB4042_02600 [Leptolyngbyaceae cyanobacterium]
MVIDWAGDPLVSGNDERRSRFWLESVVTQQRAYWSRISLLEPGNHSKVPSF